MSLMGMLFGSSEEEGIRNEEGVILKPIRVLNAKGEKIATVTAEESLSIVQEKEQGQIRLIQLNERHEEILSLCPECGCPKRADGYDGGSEKGYQQCLFGRERKHSYSGKQI